MGEGQRPDGQPMCGVWPKVSLFCGTQVTRVWIDGGVVWLCIKNEVWNYSEPDIYMDGKYLKVQENDFENRFWPILPLGVVLGPPLTVRVPPYDEKSEIISEKCF